MRRRCQPSASVGILTKVGGDEFGAAITEYVASLGIDTSLIRTAPSPNGLYLTGADPGGRRDFIYSRRGSALGLLGPQDVMTKDIVDSARSLLVSGITQAISPSAAAAALRRRGADARPLAGSWSTTRTTGRS